ncbi:MAG TPA: SprT-like domain-containing protein [Bryobacteraceae bacterium]|jgi:hypothetical protein|nr:SprT-like domain-containing protein [Bryobacteraceae bacterium]
MSEQELEELCRQWQQVLRLLDWKITVRIRRMRDMDECFGRARVRHRFKEADVEIADAVDRGDAQPDLEQTLVHELIHLHFHLATPEGGDSLCVFEQGIDLTAWALVNLKRSRG